MLYAGGMEDWEKEEQAEWDAAVDRLQALSWDMERARQALRVGVLDAYRLGLGKSLIHDASGVSRTTINKWIDEERKRP